NKPRSAWNTLWNSINHHAKLRQNYNLSVTKFCKWNDSIHHNGQGQYIIHLCYNGVLPHNPRLKPPTINEMKIRSNGRNISLTFEELAEIPDAEWLKKFDASVYDLYPQTISARDSIRRILLGLPLLEHPVYNPTLHYLQVPSKTCPPQTLQHTPGNLSNNASHDVVIIYKSAVYNFHARQHLRQLFNFSGSGLDVHVVFSVGLPKSSGGNVFQRDGFNVTLGGRSGKLYKEYKVYRKKIRRALDDEMI
uniref:Glutaredoxin domain-containing protein n=1 Tax=Mesocestoides corti TaxID=53468 RepID=A0A5K3EJN7_MESCO